MEFPFSEIEEEIKEFWKQKEVYKAENNSSRPKYYVLDMFPYPSGAGLHVGHPLGYIASDIIARYKRLKGFNVLHPMGFDSFGLPAEQYAIQTGQHPAITSEENIATFKKQLDKIGFSFDWSREIKTHDPKFYKWTQWIFIQLFHSWYNKKTDKAESIQTLISEFEKNGNTNVEAVTDESSVFSADEWRNFSAKQKSDVLLNYRIAYIADSWVNWCAALGTVLANDEVKDGVSERGGYPVERKLMKQWSMRIIAYADRLLEGLNRVDFSEAMKETQRNWIGRSEGCTVRFELSGFGFWVEVFTTRPDTIFGATFITLAPEHELIDKITTPEYKQAVDEYVKYAKNRSERERMTDIKKITGQFTGAYAIHPFTDEKMPVWIAEYVLAGYGTGAVMAVPGHDLRDYAFAKHFSLPIKEVVAGGNAGEPYEGDGININSAFLNGLKTEDAKRKIIDKVENRNLGKRKVNYKLRDAVFGRQRYWGEPIPIWYDEEGIPQTVDEKDLPLLLPEVDKYLPTETGEPPLARAKDWVYRPHHQPLSKGEGSAFEREQVSPFGGDLEGAFPLETTTMPGWAGSCWYYLRYEDPHNENEFASQNAIDYWQNIDLYLGGDEHGTGHLIYFRFWTKFLFDRGWIPFDEPAKKLVNQGKIQGVSAYVYRLPIFAFDARKGLEHKPPLIDLKYAPQIFISADFRKKVESYEPVSVSNEVDDEITEINKILQERTFLASEKTGGVGEFKGNNKNLIPLPISISCMNNDIVNIDCLKSEPGFSNAIFLPSDKPFRAERLPEKMSKSKYNVINPDEVVSKYGADAFRMYEMFLGPLEASKPWDTNGIEGVSRFIKKLWKLFYDEEGKSLLNDEEPTHAELKILHHTIKKSQDDIEKLSFNTSVSAFMICVNELTEMNCHKRKIIEPLLIIISPYAPFVTEYLWRKLGHEDSINGANFPVLEEKYLIENSFEYPVAVNGKTRHKINLPLDLSQQEVEEKVLSLHELKKYFEGKNPKKVIFVKGRMINVVV